LTNDPSLKPGFNPRPPIKISGNTPPAALPLAFFQAGFIGLIACGTALIIARNNAVADPTSDPCVAAAHLGMLATLSMGVLGAMHQFIPVVTNRPLRSVKLGWATFATWLIGSWCLPLGIGFKLEHLVEAGGFFAAAAIILLTVNCSPSLQTGNKSASVIGLRFSLIGFLATACFGVVYVVDRQGNWFDLTGHVVLAHASIGLLGWLGLTYISVSERLYPMFLLAHVPGKRLWGLASIYLVPSGLLLFVPGMLFSVSVLSWLGGCVIFMGLLAHLISLGLHLKFKKRKFDLYFLFVITGSVTMVAGAVMALLSGLVISGNHRLGIMFAATSVVVLGGWILEVFVGHIHKVIPFVLWSMLREKGIKKNISGTQLMFGDLYNHNIARATYILLSIGIGSVAYGFADSRPAGLAIGGVLFLISGILLSVNFSFKTRQLLKAYNHKEQDIV